MSSTFSDVRWVSQAPAANVLPETDEALLEAAGPVAGEHVLIIGHDALTNTFGRMVGDERQGWALFAVMAVMFLASATAIYASESSPNPALAAAHVQVAGNMEGKDVRFGVGQSSLFATVSTASSDGAVDSMHDSYMPLSGLILLSNTPERCRHMAHCSSDC